MYHILNTKIYAILYAKMSFIVYDIYVITYDLNVIMSDIRGNVF